MSPILPLAAGGLGVLSQPVVSQVEVDSHSHHLILLVIFQTFSWTLLPALLGYGAPIGDALTDMVVSMIWYSVGLFGSMSLYRGSLHSLRKFPGPFLARFSKWYGVWLAASDLQYHLQMEELHQVYGDYVRTGPRELSVIDTNAVPSVHGASTMCSKGPWYDMSRHIEGSSLQSTRSKKEHSQRRRAWDRGFNAKALRGYEPRVNRHTRELLQQLSVRAGQTLRISDWVNFYSFDVMGDVGFSRSFEMVKNGKEDDLIKSLHKSMHVLGILTHVPWMISLLLRLPGGAADLNKFMAWCSTILKDRKKIKPEEPDILSWLMDEKDEGVPQDLNADARLLIVAGSDTTAASLTWAFYELIKSSVQLKKLQAVVDSIPDNGGMIECDSVANVPHLDGVINETLRLHPPVPSGVQRETPPQGLTVGDIYIPGKVLIWIPPHTIQRDERYFKDGLSFIPERWTTRPEMIMDKRAFIPFGIGAYSCVGQKLAMMELRVVIANIVRNFDIALAPTETGESLLKDTKDTFTLTTGTLDIVLTARKQREGQVAPSTD